jgi:hypothetical protein
MQRGMNYRVPMLPGSRDADAAGRMVLFAERSRLSAERQPGGHRAAAHPVWLLPHIPEESAHAAVGPRHAGGPPDHVDLYPGLALAQCACPEPGASNQPVEPQPYGHECQFVAFRSA